MVAESIGATWIVISWDSHSTLGIVSYNVTATGDSGGVSVVVNSSDTEVNVTGLQPGTKYTLTVVSVSVNKEVSPPSDPLLAMTLLRPGILCISDICAQML